MSRKLIAFFETYPLRIMRVVNSDRFPTVLFHYGETGHIRGAVAHVDHVRERNWADSGLHVIVYVLRHIEQALVDPKKVLRFLGVADDTFRKRDPVLLVDIEFAAEHSADEGPEPAPIDQDFQA